MLDYVDHEYQTALDEAHDGSLSETVRGIIRQLQADHDLTALSQKQRKVYDRYILPLLCAYYDKREQENRQRRWDAAG